MKSISRFGLILFLAVAAHTTLLAQSPIEQAKRIVFLGDSITYDGKYIAIVETELRLRDPKRQFEIIDIGLPSETVSGLSEDGHAGGQFPRPSLHERLDRVLAQLKPDLVVACYGMNDGIYLPLAETRFTAYRDGIQLLRDKVAKVPAQIIHVTPAVFDPVPIRARVAPADKVTAGNPYQNYDEVLTEYSRWLVSKRADGWQVIDLHTRVQESLIDHRKSQPEFTFSPDGVHPNLDGHFVMAIALLNGLEISSATLSAIQPGYNDEKSKRGRLFKLIHQRQRILTDAWLTKTGHLRPMKAGLPLDEAVAKSETLNLSMHSILQEP